MRKNIIVMLVSFTKAYLVMAFLKWSVFIDWWTAGERAFTIIIMLCFMGISYAIEYGDKKTKK